MENSIGLFFQRFYFSLGSGFIINAYILSIQWALGRANCLPNWLQLSEPIEPSIAILIFVFTALIIDVFILGFTELCIQGYLDKYNKFLKRNKKNNSESTPKKVFCRYEPYELNFIGKFLFFNFIKSTTAKACVDYWRRESDTKEKDPCHRFTFMYDNGNLIDDPEKVISIMRINALKISKESESNEFYRFRDLSFMGQLLHFSLLLISLFSFVATFYVAFSLMINCGSDGMAYLLKFFIISCFISTTLIIITTKITCGFSKRYIRELGEWYDALGMGKEEVESAGAVPKYV